MIYSTRTNHATSVQASASKQAIAVGHVDDAASMEHVCATLAAIHGASYAFDVARWQKQTTLLGEPGSHHFYFVMQSEGAMIRLAPGQRVRGVPATNSYQLLEAHWAEASAPTEEELWPGDVVCVDEHNTVIVEGLATCFHVACEATTYPLPTVALLRYLSDRPGGCAAYPGAFRREALPPMRSSPDETDKRNVNRVNEHTLDMRIDRDPRPQPHHHGPVAIGAGEVVNHSETALVLARTCYALPPLQNHKGEAEAGHVILYRQPDLDPSDTVRVAVRPGSVVVTPATVDGIAGHCFENAFAMLLAIPGFVSPHNSISNAITLPE